MRAADRGHLDDLPVDQLDPVLGREDAGLGHAVVGVDVEAAPRSGLSGRSRVVSIGRIVSDQADAGQGAGRPDYAAANVRTSSAVSLIPAAAMFSSRCAVDRVPGIGRMVGRAQAARRGRAGRGCSRARRPPRRAARRGSAKGAPPRTRRPPAGHRGRTRCRPRCSGRPARRAPVGEAEAVLDRGDRCGRPRALELVQVTLEMPMWRILPARTRSCMAPTDSSIGVSSSTQWSCSRSIVSRRSCFRLASQMVRIAFGRPSRYMIPGPTLAMPHLVVITTPRDRDAAPRRPAPR